MQSPDHHLIDPPTLASELGVPLATLYQWRHEGKGPKALKVGRHLRYRRKDVDAWLDCLARGEVLGCR